MNRKRILLLGGALVGVLLLSLLGLVLFGGKNERTATPPTLAPSLLPSEAVTAVAEATLPYTIEQPAISPDGTLFFATNRATALASAKSEGSGLQLLTPQRFRRISSVAWAPDASRAVVKDATGGTYLFTTGNREVRPLNQKIDNAVWAPDGLRFASTFEGKPQVFDVRTDRGEPLTGVSFGNRFAWSADGKRLAVYESVEEGTEQSGGALRVYDLVAGKVGEQLTDNVVAAQFFADGEHLLIATKTSSERAVKVLGLDRSTKVIGGPAEFGTALRVKDSLLLTGRSTGTDANRIAANDNLWTIAPDGAIRQLAELDKRGFTSQLVGGQYFITTNAKLYRINLGGENG